MLPTYRQYLQKVAQAHNDRNTRQQAQALLNVVGDDGKLDANFINQNRDMAGKNGITWGSSTSYGAQFGKTGDGRQVRGAPVEGLLSNGYSAYDLNRGINSNFQNLYKDELSAINEGKSGWWKKPVASNPYATQQARDNALKLAFIDEQLGRMPSKLDLINEAERNRYAHIENDFNRANDSLDTSWKQTQEDYNRERGQRLAKRRRQIGVADDDFKKQRDAYSRYFSRTGSGSSSTAQFTVPTLLARATQKIRNDIEDNNAEEAQTQDTNFNRANLAYKREKDDILTERNRQRNATKEDFETRRSGYWDEVGRLERQKADISNRSVADIMAAGRASADKAQQYADSAVRAGGVSEGIKFKPIEYEATKQKDWTYDPTKTKVENQQGEEDNENLYKKYFRDKEEEKKKKGWISATAA